MPLPASLVERLFEKLAIRYGAAFMQQWRGADPAHVKADWAEVLEGFDGPTIGYALRYLPSAPINAGQFRDICRRAPTPDPSPRLPRPDERPDPQRVAELMARISAPPDDTLSHAERVAARLREIRARNGGRLSGPQAAMLAACDRYISPTDALIGQFDPIPDDALPPGMRVRHQETES